MLKEAIRIVGKFDDDDAGKKHRVFLMADILEHQIIIIIITWLVAHVKVFRKAKNRKWCNRAFLCFIGDPISQKKILRQVLGAFCYP